MAIRNPDWLPFLGWQPCPDEVVRELELDPSLEWKGFAFSWLGMSIIFFVRGKYVNGS